MRTIPPEFVHMRIHWIAQHFYPEIGGMETHIREIAKRLIKKGHDVTVHSSIRTTDNRKLCRNGNIDRIQIKRYEPRLNLGYYLSYWKPIIYDCDLIVMEGYPSLINDHVRRKYADRYPLVSFSLGCCLSTSHVGRLMKRYYDRFYGIKTFKSVDSIISLTENEKKWLEDKNIDSRKINVIPAGIPDEAFGKYRDNPIKERFGFDRYILFVGRMYHEKRPLDLVRALSKLNSQTKDTALVFVGPDAGETERVLKLAKDLEVSDRVICLGRVSEKEKYSIISNCELFVLPSQWESQGIVLVEAMAQGKPVIGTNVGGIPYMIENGENGLLYNCGDISGLVNQMEYLLDDPAKSKEMGLKGLKEAIEKYQWDNIVDRVEWVYRST
jgi:glycosyltransferase involved in cell wall biosynthesis